MAYQRNNSPLYDLVLSGKHLTFPKGQVVGAFEDNTMLFRIKVGYIKRYLITAEGEKGIQIVYGPGDVFPLTPVYKAVFRMNIYSGPEQYYYEAITPLEIYAVSQQSLQKALDANPTLYKDLFHAAGLRLNSYIHRLESLSLRSANRKIAHQLVYLIHSFGQETAAGLELKVPLTHQDLADILGMARETVTRAMTDFETAGIVAPGRKIIVLDLKMLRAEAQWQED